MAGKKRILVVDDNKIINTVLRRTLELNGFDVESAFDGHEALGMVSTFKPHAVLLDVMMPKENGYRVSRMIKTFYTQRHSSPAPKIILLTARRLDDDPQREEVVLEYSKADAMVYKPFDSKILLDRLRSLLDEVPEPQLTGHGAT
jgi:DNA-binding response OmpR family regulator